MVKAPKKGGSGRYSMAEYASLLAAFRVSPGNITQAAATCGWTWHATRRVWDKGWPKFTWARPIRDVLAEEHAASKAAIADRLRQEREAADAEAEKTRAASLEIAVIEQQILVAARRNVAAAFGLSAKLVAAMDSAVGYIRSAFLEPDGTHRAPAAILASGISPPDAMRLLHRHTIILERAFNVGERIINMGRVEKGKPTAITATQLVPMSAEDAAEELSAQAEAIRLIQSESEEENLH